MEIYVNDQLPETRRIKMLKKNDDVLDSRSWCGLNRPEMDAQYADAVIFGIPFDGGVSYRGGAAEAPQTLRANTKHSTPSTERLFYYDDFNVVDAGDFDDSDRDVIFGEVERFVCGLVKNGTKFTMSLGHIAVCIAFVVVFIWIFRRSGDIRKMPVFEIVEKLMVFAVICAQLIYYYWYFILHAGGDPYPLYLCRIAGILICLTYFVHIKPLEDFAIMSCIYGGISATFFSSPKPFAFPHITSWAYFTMHIGMTYVALLRIIHYHKLIGKKELVNAMIVNFISVFGVLIIDLIYDWNYMSALLTVRITAMELESVL